MMKKLLISVALVVAFALGACSTLTVSADQQHPLKIWFQNKNGRYCTLCLVDEDTGVNYVVVSAETGGSGFPEAVAITPRFNADGSLYVSEVG